MQSLVESRLITRSIWRRGSLGLGLGALVVLGLFDARSAASFVCGGLALVAGFWVAARCALGAAAPSGSAALLGVIGGSVLKWLVVAAILALSMAAPDARAPWVVVGLVFAQLMLFVVVLTSKRQ